MQRKRPHRRLLSPIAILALLLAGAGHRAWPQDPGWFADLTGESTGHTTALFLTLPVDAAGLARGDVSLPPPQDATSLHNAIAATALLDCNSFAASHIQWLMDLRKEYAAACFPVLDVGTLSLAAQVFTIGSITNSRDIDEQPSRPSFAEFSVSGALARQIVPGFLAAGTSISYIESRLSGVGGRTLAASGDIMVYRKWMRGRLGISHAGLPITYLDEPASLPLQVGASAGFRPLVNKLHLHSVLDLECAAGVTKVADEPLLSGLSAEVTLLRYGRVRAGYEYALGSEASIAGLGAGAGARIGRYGADFGWKYQSEALGSVWGITVTARTDAVLPASAEEFYAIAAHHYAQGRLRQAIRYSRSALKLNPNMWKAHALLAKVAAEIRRNQGTEIAIIYVGNVQGQFLPFHYQTASVGGLARQAAVVREVKSRYPSCATINAGNLPARNSHPLRAGLASWYHDYVKFDASVAGVNEIALLLSRDSSGFLPSAKLVCTNLGKGLNPAVTEKKAIKVGTYSFFVAGVIAEGGDDSTSGPFTPAIEAARRVLSTPESKAATARILVVDGSWNTVRRCAEALPDVDFIICNDLSQAFEAPMKAGSSLVLSAGDSGRYVGELILRFDHEKKLASFENRLTPLTDAIRPDSLVEREVEMVRARIELEQQGIARRLANGRTAGLLPFVSNRRGSDHLFLKMPEHHAEYPLTLGDMDHSKPCMSSSAGKIAFLRSNPESGGNTLEFISIAGGERRALITDRDVMEVTFSPDGKWVYAAAAALGTKSTDIVRLTPDATVRQSIVAWEGSSERDLSISPNGKMIAFCSDRDRRWHVYLAAADGGNPIRITDVTANHRRPLFGPDTTCFAYLADRTNPRNRMDIWIHDLSTGKARQVTRLARVDGYAWVDRDRIIYSSMNDSTGLYRVDIRSGLPPQRLATSTGPGWRITDLRMITIKGQDLVIYCRECRDGRREIHAITPEGSGDMRFVKSRGSDWLE